MTFRCLALMTRLILLCLLPAFTVLAEGTGVKSSAQVKVVVGTIVSVHLKLSPAASTMHAIQVRVGAGMEMPSWFYDKQDKNLGSFKTDDIVEIRYVVIPAEKNDGRRARFDIKDIRKVPASALEAFSAPPKAPPKDYSRIKQQTAAGGLGKAQALVDDMAKAEGGYQAFGDNLKNAGLYPLSRYCYTRAIGDGLADRGLSYRARKSLVLLFQGPYQPDLAKVADGSYTEECVGYLGPNKVTVTVKDHAITDVAVQCPDNRTLTSLDVIPKEIVGKQGIKGVDAVTGATITSHAIMAGAAAALKDAEK